MRFTSITCFMHHHCQHAPIDLLRVRGWGVRHADDPLGPSYLLQAVREYGYVSSTWHRWSP